jgi:hypothetical protein
MPTCPHVSTCLLRQAIGMQSALGVWQSCYCDSGFQRCERFKLATSGLDVPPRLLPNGRLLEGPEAMIVAGAKRTS